MTSFVIDHRFDCAPHAARSTAMALALSLNVAVVLVVLLPAAQPMRPTPLPQALIATLLPPPVAPPPVVPVVRAVKPIIAPRVRVPTMEPVLLQPGSLPALAPVVPLQVAPSSANPVASAASGDSDAVIAYATATPPPYPPEAMRAGMEGTVLLKVLVDSSGRPEQVVIARSSGSRVLDLAARKHVLASWRFHPAMHDGHAIAAWAMVPVRFHLNRE